MATAPYRIEFKPSAIGSLRGLSRDLQRRIGRKINTLAVDPRPPKVEKIEGGDRMYRVRVGDYRIVYQVQDDRLLVLVIRIGHRKDVYRNL